VEYFVTSFDHLSFRKKGMIDAFFQEFFINGIKDEIWSVVLMAYPQLIWKQLNMLRMHNKSYFPKAEDLILFPALDPQIMSLETLPSRSKNQYG